MTSDLLHAKKLINTLDLTQVINRLIYIEKWSKKHAIAACQQYRNYLFLKKKYGSNYTLPPSIDIDEVWHAHILHSEDYYAFCKQVFGHFLHHHPHHGKNNEVSSQKLAEMFENHTQSLYLKEFGEYIYTVRVSSIWHKIVKIYQALLDIFLKRKNIYA